MVRDHIVFGVRSSKIREKLINEGSELTLQKCLDIARTYEISQEESKDMDNDQASASAPVHAVQKQKQTYGKPPKPPRGRGRPQTMSSTQPGAGQHHHKQCDNCGRNHNKRDVCPAKGQVCNYCSKRNHFAVVCRKKITDSRRKVHVVNESDLDTVSGENYDFFIDSIDYDKNKSQAFAKVTLGPKEKLISMKIDSGSQVNVIPKSIFHTLGINGPLQNTNKRLTAHDGTPLKVDGYVRLKCPTMIRRLWKTFTLLTQTQVLFLVLTHAYHLI